MRPFLATWRRPPSRRAPAPRVRWRPLLEELEERRTPTVDLDLGSLVAGASVRLVGSGTRELLGASVSAAGDVDGDGTEDFLLGAPGGGRAGVEDHTVGKVYVIFGRPAGLPPVLDLTNLDPSLGFSITGAITDGELGQAVSGAGDVNGDGKDDLILGAPATDLPGKEAAGRAYVLFGRTGEISTDIDLESWNSSLGFRIQGEAALDQLGLAVAGAGDVNGDGFDDVVIGARYADGGLAGEEENAGRCYVIFGKATGFADVNVNSLAVGAGFRIEGKDAYDDLGSSVAGAGDVNGDGIDDLIVGALGAAPDNRSAAGESYVIFGRPVAEGFPAVLNLIEVVDTGRGFCLEGLETFPFPEFSGCSVSGIGDVNGDGCDDLLIGALGANGRAGRSYVVFGRRAGVAFPKTIALNALSPNDGFRIVGESAADRFGLSVSGAGDVDGDGLADLVIGAPYAGPRGRSGAGRTYVLFGTRNGFGALVDPSQPDFLANHRGFRIDGLDIQDRSGYSVSGAGDVNGDGFDDLLIGAPHGDRLTGEETGESYLIFGRDFAGKQQRVVPPPVTRAITAHLETVRLGRRKVLMIVVTYADNGEVQSRRRAPFQKPVYRGVTVLVRDATSIEVTGLRGGKRVRRTLAVN